jgi:NADPH-dependent 2,4-dienoyl-CoA reductase/sulfur reductase-like enzyme/nitrite reductase/ring-hydroxylating ferredoxin subunit
MGATATLTGPDLAEGIALADLGEAAPLRGHFAGQPVVLVRRGGEVFALHASCTHYGAPLDEGLVVGETLRCPWHHACFSLRTGEALRAPALARVENYAVQVANGRVRVTGPAADAPKKVRRSQTPSSVVIVGAGAAGLAGALAIRHDGYAGPVTLLGAEVDVPVDRPNLSKDFLAGTAPAEWMPLRDEAALAAEEIGFRAGVSARAIDPGRRVVALSDGTDLPFGALLLAPGAEPIQLPLPGADQSHVHTLRSWADARVILAAASSAHQVVILGAGFIGLEVASSLRRHGLSVAVVAPESLPLAKQLGPAVGAAVQAAHEAEGTVFHLGAAASSIGSHAVVLADGRSIPADLVIVGVGVRPRLDLARAAGIAIDGGIAVDARLQSSITGIFAAGDAASWPDPHTGRRIRIEHWVLAERMGQVAARNLLGGDEVFDAVPFFWSMHPGELVLRVIGVTTGWEDAEVHGDLAKRDALVAYRAGSRILAVLTVGRDRECLEAEALLEADDQAGLCAMVGSR